MWTRRELKERAKISFKRNYWKSVLVALLVSFLVGGSASGSAISGSFGGTLRSNLKGNKSNHSYNYNDKNDENFLKDFSFDDDHKGKASIEDEFMDELMEDEDVRFLSGSVLSGLTTSVIILFLIVFVIVFAVLMAIVLLIDVFLANPIEVGLRRFFFRNLNEMAEVKETMFSFDHCYKNVVEVMFFRGLFQFLWTLLFIIPGIVKAYEYCMIPYILAENPDMPRDQVFALSRQMMDGNKWKTFILDLSFILWDLLSLITLGIVGIFYVQPYKCATFAALYDTLKYQGRMHEEVYPYGPAGGMDGMNFTK